MVVTAPLSSKATASCPAMKSRPCSSNQHARGLSMPTDVFVRAHVEPFHSMSCALSFVSLTTATMWLGPVPHSA